jgi:hypothetical protein
VTLREIQRYCEAADQKRLAIAAIEAVRVSMVPKVRTRSPLMIIFVLARSFRQWLALSSKVLDGKFGEYFLATPLILFCLACIPDRRCGMLCFGVEVNSRFRVLA